jgi:L-threonylcarbamoyladenylate synthase
MAAIGKNTSLASELLMQGKLVAIPTETVYGLAANALDTNAVAGIFEAKNRPQFDPLILHTYSVQKAMEYVHDFPETLRQLAQAFWPGPLTLLLEKKATVPDLVTSGLSRVAVRIPNHPLTLELLKVIPFPLAAPSANPFGYVSPTSPDHVNKQLGDKVSYILDGGNCEVGIESTIVGMEDGKVCVYRLGGLVIEELEKVCGKVELKINSSNNPAAPGQLKSHYAPMKQLIIGNINENLMKYKNAAVISFGNTNYKSAVAEFNLSPSKNLKEAAANLFSALRQMDESKTDVILVEVLPETGLGRAINDRLKRAAVK